MVLYSKGATDITNPKWSKTTNFCNSHSDFPDFLDFLLFSSDWMFWDVHQTNCKFLKEPKTFHKHETYSTTLLFIGQFTLKIVSFFSVRSLWQSLLLKIYHFNDKLSLLLEWPCLRQPFLVFFPLNFNNVFILEYIVRNDFVPVLKTFSRTAIYSIIGSSSILIMVDHCYPYNIWYLAFCGELSF